MVRRTGGASDDGSMRACRMYLYYASATVNQRDDSQPGLGSQSQIICRSGSCSNRRGAKTLTTQDSAWLHQPVPNFANMKGVKVCNRKLASVSVTVFHQTIIRG